MAVETGGSHLLPRATTAPAAKAKGRSMFGRQTDSRKNTAPMFSFGSSSTRDQASKLFLSSQHVAVEQRGRTSNGTVYHVPAAMDRQIEAMKSTAPAFSFSNTERMKLANNGLPGPGNYPLPGALGLQCESRRGSSPEPRFTKARREISKQFLSLQHCNQQRGTLGADPGTYKLPECLGPQHSSLRQSQPAYSISKLDRAQSDYERLSQSLPPVGKYETWHSIGKQTLSAWKTLPSFAFGSSTWDTESKRFLTSSHMNQQKGEASPSNYDHQAEGVRTAFGKQYLSSRESPPSAGFGIGMKMPFKINNIPGPGTYEN